MDVNRGFNIYVIKFIIEIIWFFNRRAQMFEMNILSPSIDFVNNGLYVVQPKPIQFLAKYRFGTIKRRMLPVNYVQGVNCIQNVGYNSCRVLGN